jgi:hypothetical protein
VLLVKEVIVFNHNQSLVVLVLKETQVQLVYRVYQVFKDHQVN